MTRTTRWLMLAATTVVATSCGPPNVDTYGAKPYPQDVKLGSQTSPTPLAPPIASTIEPGSPGFFIPPIYSSPPAVSLAPPIAPCPSAPPLATTKDIAADAVQAAPKPGTYTYRQSGSYQLTGHPAVQYPPVVVIKVLPSYVGRLLAGGVHDPSDSAIYWDQIEATTLSVTGTISVVDTTYKLVPGSEIDIYAVLQKDTSGTLTTFQPQGPNAAQYAVFPASSQPQWNDTADDAINQEQFLDNAIYNGRKDKVDACGTLIDAYRIDFGNLTQTSVGPYQPPNGCLNPGVQVCVTPGPVGASTAPQQNNATFKFQQQSNQDYNLTGSYDLATQYNGLLVGEDITETAVDGSWTNHRTLTIDSVTPG